MQKGDRTVLIDETDVVYASAARGYTYLKLATERVLVSFSPVELAERLGDRAFRAHRSHLVNLDHVEELAPYFGGQLVLVMREQDRSRIPVSRRQAEKSADQNSPADFPAQSRAMHWRVVSSAFLGLC